MKILTVNNQKGGVGKTTLALHLALAGVEADCRTLLVDLDAQGSASLTALRDPSVRHRPGGALALFGAEPLAPIAPAPTPQLAPPAPLTRITPTASPLGFDVLHGHRELDRADSFPLEHAAALGGRLRALPYELVVIDTPPAAIEARHLAPLFWADVVVIPLEANRYSRAALEDTLETVAAVQRANLDLERFFVINRYRTQDPGQREYAAQLKAVAKVEEPELGLHAAVSHALDEGRPVWREPRASLPIRDSWRTLCGRLVA